jgi:hypothetical protein
MPLHVVNTLTSDPQLQIFQRQTILTDAEIKALPTTPIVLVPAPGVGKAIHAPVVSGFGSCILRFSRTADYTNLDTSAKPTFKIGVGDNGDTEYGSNGDMALLITTGGWVLTNYDLFGLQSGPLLNLADWENQPLYFSLYNAALGNLTGGHVDNSLSVTVTYSIVDV